MTRELKEHLMYLGMNEDEMEESRQAFMENLKLYAQEMLQGEPTTEDLRRMVLGFLYAATKIAEVHEKAMSENCVADESLFCDLLITVLTMEIDSWKEDNKKH